MSLNLTPSRWLILYCILFVSLTTKAEEASELELKDEDIPVIEGQGPDIIIAEDEDVLVLTSENFHYVVATRDPILVEFYAPWCGHCKTLAPEFAKAAQTLKPEGIRIGKVDATVEAELAKEFEVTGFPTLKLFRAGKPTGEYQGTRTAQGLVEYMRQQADPSYTPPPTAVLELTDDSFSAAIDAAPLSLVEFYAPWCKHCQALIPEYESAAQSLASYGIVLAKVDATENKKVAEQFGITGYPAFKLFRKGRTYEYKGGREAATIISYMKDQQRLPSQEVRTVVNARNAILRTQPTVMGLFTADTDDIYTEFIAAANELRGQLPFVHTFDASIAARYGMAKEDTLAIIMPEVYHSEHEDKTRVMDMEQLSSPSSTDLVSWALSHSAALVGERTPENEAFLYTARPLLVVYGEVDFSHQHLKATQFLRTSLLPLASQHPSLTFAISSEERYATELTLLGLDDSSEDTNAAIWTSTHRYAMDPDDDFLEELTEFIGKFEAGKLKPYVKSQPKPGRQSGPVRVVVAKTFDKELAAAGDKGMLIEFYAPWCGHCKKLEPVFKQLAKQTPDAVVAKMDATANDVPPQFTVKGFPTIYYVKASDPEHPVLLEGGDRSLKALKAFIKEQQNGDTSKGKDEL